MFFDKDSLSFCILDVVSLTQENVAMLNTGRNFDALSFRFASDATLDDGKVRQMGDGEICFVPARVTYTRRATQDELIAVHMSVSDYVSAELEHFTAQDSVRFGKLFREIYAVWNAKRVGYRYKCAALLNEIFEACFRENYHEPEENSLISPSLAYLNEHLTDPSLTVSDLAAHSYVSEVYFRRLFREKFGMSPQKYIIEHRIQHAAHLMSTGYYTLHEVALLSGYTDYPYFSSEFKRLKGVSPTEYLYNFSQNG